MSITFVVFDTIKSFNFNKFFFRILLIEYVIQITKKNIFNKINTQEQN